MTEAPEPGWGGMPQPPQPPQPPPAADPYGQTGWAMRPESGPGYSPPYPPHVAVPERTSGLAIAAFVVAIGAWLALPIVGAIVALVLAHLAAEEIRNAGGRLGGQWAVTAARIISWIHLALAVVAVIFFVVILSIIGGSGFG